jgi:osmoprotectant transport system ATP-binding protein
MRLQDEFLGLQEKVKKTVVFVTHDIDEAIKMGDRIAILREGGVLAQYDTPREILTHPADPFVAQFVGADRGLKRLALTKLSELKLIEPNGLRGELRSDGERRVPVGTSVRDALSIMLSTNGEPLTVIDDDGRVEGLFTLALVEQLLSDDGAGPPPPAARDGEQMPSAAQPAPQGRGA